MKLTLEKIQALSDEELQLKVAKMCGWEKIRTVAAWVALSACVGKPYCYEGPKWEGINNSIREGCYRPLPDFPHDINAMHEAEATLKGKKQYVYAERVANMIGLHADYYTGWDISLYGVFDLLRATARQRAEAFVIVMQNG